MLTTLVAVSAPLVAAASKLLQDRLRGSAKRLEAHLIVANMPKSKRRGLLLPACRDERSCQRTRYQFDHAMERRYSQAQHTVLALWHGFLTQQLLLKFPLLDPWSPFLDAFNERYEAPMVPDSAWWAWMIDRWVVDTTIGARKRLLHTLTEQFAHNAELAMIAQAVDEMDPQTTIQSLQIHQRQRETHLTIMAAFESESVDALLVLRTYRDTLIAKTAAAT